MELVLGQRRYDLTDRALVMGILNRTHDSFFDKGRFYDRDAFLRRAAQHIEEGADLLDVGGVKAGAGPEVSEAEEIDRVVPAIEWLAAEFDVSISVDTWNGRVAAEAFAAGASLGNDISGFSDPEYLPAAVEAGAAVVATHLRTKPRVDEKNPPYPDGVVPMVKERLVQLSTRALDAGVPPEKIVIDPGIDLQKSTTQSMHVLRQTATFTELGYPVFLAVSNKHFLGEFLGLPLAERSDATAAAVAVGVALGARVVRVHDVKRARRVCDVLAAISAAA